MVDPITGMDDGQPDYPALTPDYLDQAVQQARGLGAPMAPPPPPGPPQIDPVAAQQAVAQARGMAPPAMLARPQPAPQQPMFGVFAPPAQMRKERESSSWSQRPMGKEEKAAVGDLSAAYDQQIEARQQMGQNAAERANLDAARAEDIASQQAARAFKREQLVAEGEKQLTGVMTEYKRQFDKYKSMDIKEYWSEAGTLKSVLAGIAMGLGELGKMRPGGENVVMQGIQQAVAQDFAKQKMAIERQADVLRESKENIETVNKFRQYQLNNLELKEAAAYDAIAARWEANLKAAGIPEAAAKASEESAILRQQKAEKIQGIHQFHSRQIGGSIEKAMTDNVGGMPGGLTSPQALAQQRYADAQSKEQNARNIYNRAGEVVAQLPEGTPAAEAQKVKESIGHYENIKDLATKLRDSYKTKGRELPGDEVKRREQLQTDLKYEYNQFAAKQGAFSKPDQELIEKATGTDAGIYVLDPTATFDELLSTMDRRMSTTLGTRGVKADQVMPKLKGPSAEETKRGKDGKLYRRTPQGWVPAE
jgi:hypothetical protein